VRIFDKFAQFVLHSRLRAVVMAVFFVFLPLFRPFGWAVLGLVTLRKGAIEGGFVLIVLGLFLVSMGLQVEKFASQEALEQTSSVVLWLSTAGLLLSGVLVWFFALILRQYASWSKVLQAGLWGSVFIIACAHIIHPDLASWWVPVVEDSLRHMQKMFKTKLPPITEFSALAGTVMTGMQIVMALLVSLLSLLIARWWQASLYNPGGLGQELLQARLGIAETGLLGVLALLMLTEVSVLGKAIAVDLIPVVGAIFILAGICLVHRFLAVMKRPWMGVIIFYGLIPIVGFRNMMFLLISLAVIDSWVNLGGRFIKR
jgi:hypothetical protein